MVDYHQFITDIDGFDKEFGPLVEVLEACKQSRFIQRVSAISTCGLDTYQPTSSGAKKIAMRWGGLGLRSHEGELFGSQANIFKGSRVDRDRLVEQALQLRRKDCVDVTLPN